MTAFSLGKGVALNSAEELEAALRQIGAVRYHNLHPFHRLLHGGKLNKGQVQAWALNRHYYQSTIPIKDAVVISRFRDRGIRREWRHRLEDHDGDLGTEGGIERWLKLTEGLGLDSAYVESTEGILPATRFAVEAYVHFVRDKTPLEAIASSLTELFAPNLHEERISGMLAHYDFVNPDIMSYFSRRMQQAPGEIAVEVLQLCDGVRSVEVMIDQLAAKYTADRGAIATDVIAMLQDLADKGFLTEAREKTS